MFLHRFAPPRPVLAVACVAALLSSGSRGLADSPAPSDTAAIVHALERLTFGATSDDIARARRMGLGSWIDAQLNPASIDDAGLERRLARFETLTLSSAVLVRDYFTPARRERRERQMAATSNGNDAPKATAAPESASSPERMARRIPSEAQRKQQMVLLELSQAKVLRAVYSERQLEEVLVDFWFNHFNVFAGKGRTAHYVTEYERDAIRPHVLGRFRDLLEAAAKSPAMLFYLDNWTSSAPEGSSTLEAARMASAGRTPFGLRRRSAVPDASSDRSGPRPPRPRGLNENYARELLELHTLGVDGGYTQRDIADVARAFTGWTIERPQSAGFRFVSAMHDAGAKTILGHRIAAGGGEEDGERVLDILASHPSTARFLATKLARRFVSDQPPSALVDRLASRFRETNGDLRTVVRALVTSPEFFAASERATKVKTPLEFVASALRASGAVVENATPIVRALRELGMPLYLCQPPTGYDDAAETWVSSGALVSRMNFALDLASGRLRSVTVPGRAANLDERRADLAATVLHGRASTSTLATMAKAPTDQQLLALTIGSPEFQRR